MGMGHVLQEFSTFRANTQAIGSAEWRKWKVEDYRVANGVEQIDTVFVDIKNRGLIGFILNRNNYSTARISFFIEK